MFQHNIIHTGIKSAVNCIIIKAKPSIPTIIFKLKALNHVITCKNWKWVAVVSKKNSKEKLTFKIISDQNNEKLRINCCFVLSIKAKIKQPTKGKKIKNNNIKNEI